MWLPLTNSFSDLILTKDDYSRKVVGRKLVERETSFDHLSVARKTIEDHGLPLAYYVDQHSIFRFVKHRGIHVSYTVGEDEGKIQFKFPKDKVTVCFIPEKKIMIFKDKQKLWEYHL